MVYKTILADPPWSYRTKSPTCRLDVNPAYASATYYYTVMALADIKSLDVAAHADPDGSCLWLCATTPMLPEAFQVMKAWGWKYKTMLTWHKTNTNCMGYWFRVCTEHILVGVRGKVRSFRSMQRTLFEAPRGRHSEKPDISYRIIESVSSGPRLELFARKKREGWHAWGNEIESDVTIVPHR